MGAHDDQILPPLPKRRRPAPPDPADRLEPTAEELALAREVLDRLNAAE